MVTYLFLYAVQDNDVGWATVRVGGEGGGAGAITNDALKFRKIIEFQSS